MTTITVRTTDLAKLNCCKCGKPMIVYYPKNQRTSRWKDVHTCWDCVGNSALRNGMDESNVVDITNEIIEFGEKTTTLNATSWFGKTIE